MEQIDSDSSVVCHYFGGGNAKGFLKKLLNVAVTHVCLKVLMFLSLDTAS